MGVLDLAGRGYSEAVPKPIITYYVNLRPGETMEIEYIARCPKHGYRGLVVLDDKSDPLATWACHRKVDGRWCRFRVRSYEVRPAP